MSKKHKKDKKTTYKAYERELRKLEIELVKLQGWIQREGLKIAVVFEGRDSPIREAPLNASPVA